MKKILSLAAAVAISSTLLFASDALAAKKGIGVSCKKGSDCASGYCKANKAHLKGYVGTCQRK